MARRVASFIRWVSPEQFHIRIADLPMMRGGSMISAQKGVGKTNENRFKGSSDAPVNCKNLFLKGSLGEPIRFYLYPIRRIYTD